MNGTMRQLRYSVASSLDGFIAGPNGEFDWIPNEPDYDFAALYASFSAIVMGRKSYELVAAMPDAPPIPLPAYVYSRSLPEGERNGMTFAHDGVAHVRGLKEAADGKPLWLWGGGELFRQLASAGLVDGVDVAIMPVLLGAGIPLLAPPAELMKLKLRKHQLYPKSGMVFVEYDVVNAKS
jgi:dihydrofolate reductase